ncbi:MAG TPA: metallophosphoesterase [Gaiellaceae bacterium]|jgi:UDP-2,3-diacylglucosamine pyrophosphatase LpxH|nr:metallophosphoesterase [Gaiellaceae bacterium]
MPAERADGVVIIGDLHMSSGDRYECFREDDALARFLEHVGTRAAAEGQHLLILGDLIDFLNVRSAEGQRRDADTSAASAVAKLERVAAEHATAFRALGVLATAGCPISIVLGNHDIELAHEAAQQRFVELVVRASGRREASERISFQPWIFHLPGVLYAEHGSQYHDLNAFPAIAAPHAASRGSIELPLGSHVTRFLIDLAESIDPGGTMRPDVRALLAACRARPALVARTLGAHARFSRALVAHSVRSWQPRRRAARTAYREHVLRSYADAAGLAFETLVALDELAALSPLAVERRALRALASRPAAGAPAELRRAAHAVHALLEAQGTSVPVCAFGHTHRAEQLQLDEGHQYVNCGTWSSLLPRALEPLGDAARFTFIDVTADDGSGRATARLLRWNDAEERAEPYVPLAATDLSGV